MIIFKRPIFIFNIWVLNPKIEGTIERKSNKQCFATTFRRFTKIDYGPSVLKHFFGPLYYACTLIFQVHF